MSRLTRRLSWIALALGLVVLLISNRQLLQVAQSTWVHAGAWLPTEHEPLEAGADRLAHNSAAETPNIASYALAPGDSVPADDTAAELPGADSSTVSGNKLSPEAARSLMQERRRELDCELALSARSPKELAKRERKWRWLPPQMAQAERQALQDAAGRLGRGCPHWPDGPEDLKHRQTERQAQLMRAFEAKDLTARLNTARPITEQFIAQLPEAMYDALLSGDPQLIAEIGWADLWWRVSANRSVPENLIDRSFLWTLVACDLGLDCLPGSPTMDRFCLRGEGICGSPNLDAAIRPLYPEMLMTLLDQQREELLQRIRTGQVAGLFDPPPPPPDGGP